MKTFKKKWKTILSVVLILLICIYAIFIAINYTKNSTILQKNDANLKIYTLWHIETFEGGGKSRLDYIKEIARYIEKENEGVLIMVKTMSAESLSNSLQTSQPDIISFGFGLGTTILPYLEEFNSTYNVRDELVESGSFSGHLMALPYIVSGYAVITHGTLTENFHCGSNDYIKPENVYSSQNLSPAETESQYEAYKDFVYNDDVTLLGTARDVFRVSNLVNLGRTSAIITPCDNYTDLVQYVGITTNDAITQEFVSLLLSPENQNKLTNYSLFSSLYPTLYTSGIYSTMETCIRNCQIPNVFAK